jgi:IS66 Orf2 like protein
LCAIAVIASGAPSLNRKPAEICSQIALASDQQTASALIRLSGHSPSQEANCFRLKLIFWDGSGLWVCAKRLERGCYRWPAAEAGQTKIVLSHEEMALLLGGIDLAGSRRRSWFRKTIGRRESRGKRGIKFDAE